MLTQKILKIILQKLLKNINPIKKEILLLNNQLIILIFFLVENFIGSDSNI